MTAIPFNRKLAKPGDKLILKSMPNMPIVFRGLGFDGDVIVRYEDSTGYQRDGIVIPKQQLMLEVEA